LRSVAFAQVSRGTPHVIIVASGFQVSMTKGSVCHASGEYVMAPSDSIHLDTIKAVDPSSRVQGAFRAVAGMSRLACLTQTAHVII